MSAYDWQVALTVCTPRQLQALNLWRRGWGSRRIAKQLDLDVSTARHHVLAGRRRVEQELERLDRQAVA